ncbi:MAG: phosphatidate cytidylyltransferase [Oscillospiraceae bacterium]|jgi:phosphatidate cytidylyltransferase|nr:phosphatidate cytidylyltransferase [Oscillospiraceae bacterium]
MKVRIITGLAGSAVAIFGLWFFDGPFVGILISLFSGMAAFEVIHTAGVKNKAMLALGTAFGLALPPLMEYSVLQRLHISWMPLLAVYFFVLCLMMIAGYEKTRFEHLLATLFGSLAVPAALSTMTQMRDIIAAHEGARYQQNLAIYFFFFAMCCSWLTDTFALFVGVRFGKHKLAPKISPKKTVEGAVGGVLLTTLGNTLFALLFNQFFLGDFRLRVWVIALLSVPLCLLSMLGDLTASVLKRNYGVKDFGRLFPGHGGVMDRFDSIAFTAPAVFLLLCFSYQTGIPLLYTYGALV